MRSEFSIACDSTSVRCLRTPGCSGRYAAYLSQFNPLAGSAFPAAEIARCSSLIRSARNMTRPAWEI